MGMFGSKTKTCPNPNCLHKVAAEAKFCTNCGDKFGKTDADTITPVPGHAGLNRWDRDLDEIARRVDVSSLRSDRAGLRKGLLVRPGQRALIIQDGKLADVLPPGHYPVSEKGVGTHLGSRLLNYLSGLAHCEIYLVVDGEFRLELYVSAAETPDPPSSGESWKPNNPEDFFLHVETAEGESVGLIGDLYIQIIGNEKFVVHTLQGRNRLIVRELQDEIQPALLSVLESVVVEEPIDRLYGNMELNHRIRDAFVERLAPTLETWGIKICRAEGLAWDFSEYEEVRRKRAEVERDKRKREADRTDLEDKFDFERFERKQGMDRERLESEERRLKADLQKDEHERTNAAEYVRTAGTQERKDLENQHDVSRHAEQRRSEIDLEREERSAQLDAYQRVMQMRLEQRKQELGLDEVTRDSEHRRQLERLEVNVKLLSEMQPAQIISILAAQNPELVPALHAYWNSTATQRELEMVKGYEARIASIYEGNQEKLSQYQAETLRVMGRVSAVRIEASNPRLLASGFGIAEIPPNKLYQDESGRYLCSKCHAPAPELNERKLCPSCQAKLIGENSETSDDRPDESKTR